MFRTFASIGVVSAVLAHSTCGTRATEFPRRLRPSPFGNGADLGSVVASRNVPTVVGTNWVFGVLVPEPASVWLMLIACAAMRRWSRV